MDNPVNEFLTAQQKRNMQKRVETQDLWHQWHTNGRKPEHLEPLINNFQGLIGQKMKDWRPPTVPKSAFEAELTKHVIGAIETYDPNRGASLNTHVNVRIAKAKRYMANQQNLARIPEPQVYLIGKIQKAQDELHDQFGRSPTHAEVGKHLGLSAKRVSTVLGSMRRDIPSSMWESDPQPYSTQREQEILPLLRYSLTEHEQQVFDHIYGYNGTPVIRSTGQLAKKLDMNESKVSRLKTAIGKKYQDALGPQAR